MSHAAFSFEREQRAAKELDEQQKKFLEESANTEVPAAAEEPAAETEEEEEDLDLDLDLDDEEEEQETAEETAEKAEEN